MVSETYKIIKNKVRLVDKKILITKFINYTKNYTIITRLKVIHILFTFVAYNNMNLYQIDVKCTFF